ncbi:helicase-related protein [Streptomyces sp. V4-01]|uniref:Helicase-related protein n=1 Tax=Actinacidiphila polyblastidii TaxID=3110430 RepID=A0ABU7P8H3_9ACTN|nr:helicase-related protein [Streptomyces sp. V4-01]
MTSPASGSLASRAPGTLVSARGRDWVVLPGGSEDLLIARPLDGDIEFTAALFPDEVCEPGFGLPVLGQDEIGDHTSAGLLRTALRIASASSAGPFRSLAGIAVQPRQYQLVPLMMALRMDTVRLLVADDVGIGKTVEAALIAKELLEQGSAARMAVLCSPALADQWQRELREKFGLEAELVLPSTADRLQKSVGSDEHTIFDHYPCTVVSTDFIKQRDRREAFLRTCPELLLVDEAHTCVGAGSGHQLRYDLLSQLAADPQRHLILVTATPHSGDPAAFAKLTGLLAPELGSLDPTVPAHRDILARHMVQRRRGDIRSFFGQDTPFPRDRKLGDTPYRLDEEYARFVADILAYSREQVRRPGGALRQRMSWWSVLALLRCVLSSPKAAAATLVVRAGIMAATSKEEADRLGRESVLELTDGEAQEGLDTIPGTRLDEVGDTAEDGSGTGRSSVGHRDVRRLKGFAERAEALCGPEHDAKLRALTDQVKALLVDGYDPIVFCRYIPTAEYVAAHLIEELDRYAHVAAVTGNLHPEARQDEIDRLVAKRGRHVLVATDCLSEGVNLQEHFGGVVHYDLSWNPTRHEQREGRVDRFGQSRDTVRAVTLFDTDTGIDGLVLEVLIRKYRDIADQTGVVVPLPRAGEDVLQALASSVLLRGRDTAVPQQLSLDLDLGGDAAIGSARDKLHKQWESAAERESRVVTKFAQSGMRPEEVERELAELRQALGDPGDVAAFAREAVRALGSSVRPDTRSGGFTSPAEPLPKGLQHALGVFEDDEQAAVPGAGQRSARTVKSKTRKAAAPRQLVFRADLPVAAGEHALSRTDPAVRAIARHILDTTLDPTVPERDRPAHRLGVVSTRAVTARTVLLLARYRMQLSIPGRAGRPSLDLVAEDARFLAWRTDPTDGTRSRLTDEQIADVLGADSDRNTLPALRTQQVALALSEFPDLDGEIRAYGNELADRLAAAHQRVRQHAGERGRSAGAAAARRITVTPAGPPDRPDRPDLPDVLGLYVYLPVRGAAQ